MSEWLWICSERKNSSGKTIKCRFLECSVSELNLIEGYWLLTLSRIEKVMEIKHAHCLDGQLPLLGLYEFSLGLARLWLELGQSIDVFLWFIYPSLGFHNMIQTILASYKSNINKKHVHNTQRMYQPLLSKSVIMVNY